MVDTQRMLGKARSDVVDARHHRRDVQECMKRYVRPRRPWRAVFSTR